MKNLFMLQAINEESIPVTGNQWKIYSHYRKSNSKLFMLQKINEESIHVNYRKWMRNLFLLSKMNGEFNPVKGNEWEIYSWHATGNQWGVYSCNRKCMGNLFLLKKWMGYLFLIQAINEEFIPFTGNQIVFYSCWLHSQVLLVICYVFSFLFMLEEINDMRNLFLFRLFVSYRKSIT